MSPSANAVAEAKQLMASLKVIDTDTHWSEPYDLWTSRAPAKYADRVPQMAEKNGRRRWWFDSDIAIGLPIASSVIDPDGSKITEPRSSIWTTTWSTGPASMPKPGSR